MDKDFLKFMGQMFLSAAKNQEQMDAFTKVFQNKTKTPLDAFLKMFEAGGSGMDNISPKSFHTADFEASYKEWLKLWGARHENEYNELANEIKQLKKEIREKDDIIKNLTIMLNTKGVMESDFVKNWDSVMKGQTEIYKNMMDHFFSTEEKEK